MFILNKNSKQIQECHNSDAIKACAKDTKNYAVADTKEKLAEVAAEMAQILAEKGAVEENINEKQKEGSEGIQEGQNNTPEGKQVEENAEGNDQQAAGQGDWKKLPEEEKLAALEVKKVDELRKIAKAEGIQGYGNMNKDTLVAMIMNH